MTHRQAGCSGPADPRSAALRKTRSPGARHAGAVPRGRTGRRHRGDLGNVSGADALGFGKAAPGASHPARYLAGTVNGGTGIFRSADGGAAWKRIDDDRHQYGGGARAVTGDPDGFGGVCPGSAAARGVLYGDPS
jgi:hypothetical protein